MTRCPDIVLEHWRQAPCGRPIISAEISKERYKVPKQVLSTWESEWVDGHHLEQDGTPGIGLGYRARPCRNQEIHYSDLANKSLGHSVT